MYLDMRHRLGLRVETISNMFQNMIQKYLSEITRYQSIIVIKKYYQIVNYIFQWLYHVFIQMSLRMW